MRVLVVTVVHDPEDARIRHRQIPALLAAGHQVVYAAPFGAFDRRPPDGVTGVDLPRARGRRRLGAVWAARRAIARLERSADVVLLHDPDLLLAVAGRSRGAPVVWDVHEDTAAALGMRAWVPRPLRGVLVAAVRVAERWAERHLALLLAEHGYAARFTRPHPVVPNSIEVPGAPPPVPGPDRVVYLGKVTGARGAAEMIAVARRLRGPRVVVIGSADGDVADAMTAADREGVLEWQGFVPNDVALPRLDGALAGLSLLHEQPNYAGSEPTKLMEYMAHGIPVITTPNPASRALVERADCGVVVPFGDVDATVAALDALRADPAERERLGRNGHRYAHEHLRWDIDGPRFVAALEDVARSRGARVRRAAGQRPRRRA